MSLDYLDKQLDEIRAKATAAQDGFSRRKNQARNDANLSAAGRQHAVDEITEQARTTLGALRQEEERLVAQKRESLERTVMGSVGTDPASVINYRDAQDRADKLEDREDAARVMTRALRSGDKGLASAVAQVALAKGYRDVYDQFAQANPTTAEAAQDLALLDNFTNNLDHKMRRALIYQA